MNFVAIDVETANADISSICQIGIARFNDGRIVEEWCSLVDPEAHFDSMNVYIHGIRPEMVKGQPRLPDLVATLRKHVDGAVTVCHTHFDRVALERGCSKYGIAPLKASWLDSARVARRTWSDVAWSGYGLSNLCRKIGYKFKAHDALEDAKAAGHVVLAALEESKIDLKAWQRRVNEHIETDHLPPEHNALHRDGNPQGDLFGEVLVFTGALRLPRCEAADLAASVGCRVESGVNKKTTILVVGNQDLSMLAGHEKSSKHRKAEELASHGQPIRIIRESDFEVLVRSAIAAPEQRQANVIIRAVAER